MLVLFGHIYAAANYPYLSLTWVSGTLDFLHSGVDLFFVLSGFCLYYPLTKPGALPNWRQFYQRRAQRLLPSYYVALGAVVVLPFVIEPVARGLGLVVSTPAWPSWQQVWMHLLLIHTLSTDTFFGLNGPFWSLGIEVQFYLAFPLAVWLMARLGWRGGALIALACVGYRVLILALPLPIYRPFDFPDLWISRWLGFGLGMIVARQVREQGSDRVSAARELFDLGGVAVCYLVAAYLLYGPYQSWPFQPKDLLFAGAYAVILRIVCREGSWSGQLLSSRVPVWFGLVSYSLYLIHLPIVMVLAPTVLAWHLGEIPALLAMGIVCMPVVVLCTWVFWYLFERPFLNVPRAAEPTGREILHRRLAILPPRGGSRVR